MMPTRPRSTTSIRAAGLLALLALLAGCSDSTAPEIRSSGQLHFIRFAPDAPHIQDTVARFYAKRGEDREVRLRYAPQPGSTETEEFLRFTVPSEALERRPDGTPFALGDSVLITVRLTDTTQMVFDFQPSGIRFSTAHPAILKIEFAHADDDVNGDGTTDTEDEQLLSAAGIWRQELASQPWVRLADIIHFETDEIEANIFGFTGYAFAY